MLEGAKAIQFDGAVCSSVVSDPISVGLKCEEPQASFIHRTDETKFQSLLKGEIRGRTAEKPKPAEDSYHSPIPLDDECTWSETKNCRTMTTTKTTYDSEGKAHSTTETTCECTITKTCGNVVIHDSSSTDGSC